MTKHNGYTPNEKWSLKRLGDFCAASHQRVSFDVWLIGKAMCLAKARCKKEGKSFTDWKTQNGFSNATTSRYMRLYELFKTDDQLERLKSIGILQAFTDAGLELPREHIPRKPRGAKKESPPPSWAVDEPEDSATDEDETEPSIELTPNKDCVAHELREVVPWQVSHLTERVTFLLGQESDLLREALPKKKCEKEKIAADIDTLVQMLSRLATTLRGGDQSGKTAA